jgi:PPOX class probable F420-dependent enzyme
MAKITDRARELLERGKNFVTLTTMRDDGKPQMNVVWGDLEGDRIAVNSAEGRRWPANVRNNPNVALVVTNHENPYEYVQVVGRVVEDTHEGADDHIDSLAKKYLDQDEYPYRQEGEQRIKFLIEPEQVKVMGG